MTTGPDSPADVAFAPREGGRWTYPLYQVVAHLMTPVMLAVFLWRSRREPLYRARMGDRFGGTAAAVPGAVWIFAASLGETRAISPLVLALLAGGHRVHLTHSSPAGLKEGQRLFSAQIGAGEMTQGYGPLDLFWIVRRFLRRLRPPVALVVEAEIWPAMLAECARAGVPAFQVNGSLNSRTLEKGKTAIGAARLANLRRFSGIFTKTEGYAANYVSVGVDPERIEIVGELKFDQAIAADQVAAARRMRPVLAGERPVFLIASSVADEEGELDEVVTAVLALPGRPFVVWVPRSPQRFTAVADRLRARGLRTATRSAALGPDFRGALPRGTDVLVGDSTGEMAFYYELADLVFVGASLNGHGGHNIVEPLAQGRPVVMGPSTFGIVFPAVEAAAAGAFESLPDTGAVIDRVAELMTDPDALSARAARARDFNARHAGAAQRTMAALAPYLGASPGVPRTDASTPAPSAPADTSVARDRPSRLER